MYVHELADRLTDYRQQTFMEAPMWWYAVKEKKQWSDAVKDRRSVLEAIQSLSSTTLAVLKAVMKLAGADPASDEKLFRLGPKLARMSGAEFRWALDELQSGGLVFSISRNWGERVYFVPRDSFALWQQLLFPFHLEERALNALPEGEVQLRAPERLLGLQLLDAWAELARSGLVLTNKGVLPKKIIARLGTAVSISEKNIARLNISIDRVSKYGCIAAFILETATKLGVLEEEEERLVWVKDKLEQWLILSNSAREACLHSLIVEHYLYRQPLLAHAAAALSALSAGQWYEASDWLHHVQSEAASATGLLASGDRQLLLSWLDTLHAFGWLERIELPENCSWFRWIVDPQQGAADSSIPLPNESEAVIVQPNGEIIVLPECDGRIRWELELMAERVSEEQLGLYRLSRKSIERAIAFGRTEAAMQAFLEWASGSPDAAAEAAPLLRDWGGKLDHLSKLASGGGSVGGEGKEYPSFHTSSQSFPMADLRTYPVYRMVVSRAGQEDSLSHYELIQHEDEDKQVVYAGLKQIPASWLNQRRAYHHSTSREIMERALQWQTPVELHLVGEIVSFVPWELHLESNSWSITGSFSGAQYGVSVRLSPESWQAMRLLVPGINFHT
ncbi:helicase-associated domain-containing protein [Paenibacillus sp. KS-LC4]|uniref:helicase-associated domain-containing protein n=1 Tax=Paenibacillus sp. KS-LC4 TaxID=2979727 RepID=UPI0030CEA8B7